MYIYILIIMQKLVINITKKKLIDFFTSFFLSCELQSEKNEINI